MLQAVGVRTRARTNDQPARAARVTQLAQEPGRTRHQKVHDQSLWHRRSKRSMDVADFEMAACMWWLITASMARLMSQCPTANANNRFWRGVRRKHMIQGARFRLR